MLVILALLGFPLWFLLGVIERHRYDADLTKLDQLDHPGAGPEHRTCVRADALRPGSDQIRKGDPMTRTARSRGDLELMRDGGDPTPCSTN
jgi:hypothetical protein